MPYVAARIAFRPVRNRGTIGGALALADPAADWLPTIVALGATMHLVGPDARRAVAAEEFFLGPYFTALGDGELLAAIEVPRLSPGARWGHAKVATKVGEYAESLAIAVVDRPRRAARLVLGAADGAPILLAEAAERALAGEPPERLRETIRRELLAAERDFAPAKLTMHTTTLERAIRDAVA
jgi:carbon-monoxide dehydrogenase medium subunit